MRRYILAIVAILMLTSCSQQSLQPAEQTAQAALNQIAPTAKAAINEVAPTVRALIPTPVPTGTPDPQYPNTLDKPLIACFAPRCNAEEAIILPAGTHYKNTEDDDGTWRFIQVQGGGQVWVVRSQLAKG
jgi:Prokaryotic membrane lipoprotein lipid attachment site